MCVVVDVCVIPIFYCVSALTPIDSKAGKKKAARTERSSATHLTFMEREWGPHDIIASSFVTHTNQFVCPRPKEIKFFFPFSLFQRLCIEASQVRFSSLL